MAISPNTTFTSGAILTAAQMNNFPRGVMGYVVRDTGNVTIGTSIADVTGASVAFTAVASRGYLVTFTCLVGKTGTAGYFNGYITDGSNNVQADSFENIAVGEFITFSINYLVTGLTAGAQTLKIRALTSTAGCTLYATGTNKYCLTVTDIGPV